MTLAESDGIDLWDAFILFVLAVPLMLAWVFSLYDLFRRHDLTGITKALWLLAILVLPLVGALAYLVARPVTVEDVAAQQALDRVLEGDRGGDAARTADALKTLSELRDKGDLTQEEFDAQKAKLLGG